MTTSPNDNHLSTVCGLLIEQMRSLRSADSAQAVETEVKRGRAIAQIADSYTSAAKVASDHASSLGKNPVPLLDVPATTHTPPNPETGALGTTRHQLQG